MNGRMNLDEIRKLKPLSISIPGMSDHADLQAGFTTRFGGVSEGPFAWLNLNFFRGDAPPSVMQNFEILSADLEVPTQNMVLSKQVHGTCILRVEESHKGMGIIRERSYGPVDGLATNIPGIMLVTYYADCVPLYFHDPVKRTICLSHSGWKGTLLDMAGESIRFMKDQYGCEPGDIRASIGPHIGTCCFEVDEDLAQQFFRTFARAEETAVRGKPGKWMLDLEKIIGGSMEDHGIRKQNICGCNLCTKCGHDVFFSHRGSGGNTGTGAAYLMLKA